nr:MULTISPECIES: AAA family ATPase [unclassified Synechococcus]
MLIRALSLRAVRVKALARHLTEVEAALSAEAVKAAFDARTEVRRKAAEAKRIRDATFPVSVLAGTGSEPWKELWEAARRFSQEQAYPSQAFPVVDGSAHCVLCQRALDDASVQRFLQFEAFVVSTVERELRQATGTFAGMRSHLLTVDITTEAVAEMLKEIRFENEALADAISAALVANEKRREAVAFALTEDKDLAPDCPSVAPAALEVEALVRQTEARVESLRASGSADTLAMTAKVQELRARKLLAQQVPLIMSEIDRKKRLAAYGLCVNDTATKGITQKSTSVTKTSVTQKLKDSFRNELDSLGFRHIEVELKEAGGSEGILYHKLLLTRAPGVDLPRVVSEGEQRCLSIAAFFAELSTADEPSGIVFDDPMSSLDYRWREGVARRLVHESKSRQVIVFTHDVVFLLLLKQIAEEEGVTQLDQHVRQLSKGAGVCAEELPWVAMPIKKKIGHLKKEWQAADKLFRDGEQATYEKEAKYLYGLLREAWERALEEVLLAGTVERFRFGVQTQQIGKIADITAEDCRTLDAAMGKCSKWLPGHDQAPAARAPVPEPVELKADIEGLEAWVGAIRSRR